MLILYLLLLSASALALPRAEKPFYSEDPRDLELLFEDFIATHGKQYAHEEEKKARFEIFKQNLAKINKKNADPTETATFGINKFADLTLEEFQRGYMGLNVNIEGPDVEYVNVSQIEDLPDVFDWRSQNAVTRVKDQQECGSCWAFSTTGALEGAYAIKHKQLIELSEQQLVDCATKNHGCAGGFMQPAIKYIIKTGGIEGESDYKYINDESECRFDASKVKAKVSKLLPYSLKSEEDTKQLLVKNGPIAIALDGINLIYYKGGIIQICEFVQISHAVLLVGYGKEGDTNYWIMKDASGNGFGEKGYFRVKYGKGINPCGMYNKYAAGAVMA